MAREINWLNPARQEGYCLFYFFGENLLLSFRQSSVPNGRTHSKAVHFKEKSRLLQMLCKKGKHRIAGAIEVDLPEANLEEARLPGGSESTCWLGKLFLFLKAPKSA